uniref:Orc1-like AAA ATPase domain-containing protein n=1 Tax=Thermosporothrix sp. COM3 TaxID=2490863 RepID=A0A455SLB7_9CHLR|nr:hypothetical protein KTC_17260 [Thermosporothrix sp. COM3]
MPPHYLLAWSEATQRYTLTLDGAPHQTFRQDEEDAWLEQATILSRFSFEGRAGHFSAIKETRARGAGYWYAYRRWEQRTRKRYLGNRLSFARLEEAARSLAQQAATPAREPQRLVPLLETKLHPPRLPLQLIRRTRLLETLDTWKQQKLIVLHAPAGFGKTTLIT